MSLHPHPVDPVPEDTAQLAAKVYPKGHPYLRIRDMLGTIYDDASLAVLYPRLGQPAFSPWRLLLITVVQYAEDLTDRQAAAATRDRIDWKYLLSLPLDYVGLDASVLSEFRTRLVQQEQAAALILDPLLRRFREVGLLTGRGKQRSDSTHVLAAIRRLNRVEVVGETLRHTLNVLAVAAPDWVQAQVPAAWVDRYGPRVEAAKIVPKGSTPEAVAAQIGRDGQALLAALAAPEAPEGLAALPAVQLMRTVWDQQYEHVAGATPRWRTDEELPPAAALVHSPYDPEARYTRKRTTAWVGYKVHLTETCTTDCPRVITAVATTPAGQADWTMTEVIHADLAARALLPTIHLVDAGYIDAEALVDGARRGIDVVGPVALNGQWQARAENGYDVDHFVVDWEHQQAHCPAGTTSSSWAPNVDRDGKAIVTIGFRQATCRACAVREHCTTGKRRVLRVRPQAEHLALRAARARQTTPAFRQLYAQRAGMEGTIAQAVACCGLHRARYTGEAKTRLQHLVTAAALNLIRAAAWFAGDPPATTRRSHFQVLMAPS